MKSGGHRLLGFMTRTAAVCPRFLQRTLARVLARLVVLMNLAPALVTRRNLELCFPDLESDQRDKLVEASLTHTGLLLFESGITFHWSVSRLNLMILRVTGEDLLSRSVDSGMGVLLLVPHFGNWEFLALYLGRFQLVALYDPPRQKTLETSVRHARQRTGAKLVPLSQAGLRTAYRTLNTGGLLGLLPDQVPDRNAGIHVPFFNQPALTMTLGHRLIRATDPIVLMASAIRVGDKFEITVEEVSEEICSEDSRTALSAMNQSVESLVMKAPEQYQWEYRRFKSPPEGQPRVY
jgi:KDO2-lipid IV(A) lauroyltransferase